MAMSVYSPALSGKGDGGLGHPSPAPPLKGDGSVYSNAIKLRNCLKNNDV